MISLSLGRERLGLEGESGVWVVDAVRGTDTFDARSGAMLRAAMQRERRVEGLVMRLKVE